MRNMMSETRMHAISVLICAFAAASVSCEASGEDVNQLTVSDFDGALQEHSFILVEFYVPWCGHSRRLFPELVKAAAHLRGNVAVARVDCSKEPGLAQRFHVRLHPTLKLFVAGFPVDYRGKGTARAIVDYCEAMMLPSVTQLSTVKSTLDFVAQNDLVLLAFYEADGEKQLLPKYQRMALKMRPDIAFGSINSPALFKRFRVNRSPLYVLFRRGQQSKAYIDEGGSEPPASVSKWLSEHAVPLVVEISQENFGSLVHQSALLMLLVDTDDAEHQAVVEELHQAAEHLQGSNVSFGYLNGLRYGRLTHNLGLDPKTLPAVALVDASNKSHYTLEPPMHINATSIRNMVSDFNRGVLVPKLRSAAPPTRQPSNDVHIVVASNFDKVVRAAAVDVVVLFSAAWCGFCASFLPVYRKVARTLGGSEQLQFMVFDVDENDVPHDLHVTTLPHIMLFKQGGADGIVTYSGKRLYETFKAFVEQNSMSQMTVVEETGEMLGAKLSQQLDDVVASMQHAVQLAAQRTTQS